MSRKRKELRKLMARIMAEAQARNAIDFATLDEPAHVGETPEETQTPGVTTDQPVDKMPPATV